MPTICSKPARSAGRGPGPNRHHVLALHAAPGALALMRERYAADNIVVGNRKAAEVLVGLVQP